MSSTVITKELTNSRIEKKKKVFAVCVDVLQRTSLKIPGKLTNYNSAEEIFMQQSILLKWNEISFSLEITTYL